jgi:FKBP-type peptidyl-prolyl cis-trans isomerase FkpA
MRSLFIAVALFVATTAIAAPPDVKTDEQKTLYALGYAVADNLKPFSLTAAELEIVKAGFSDGVLQKKPAVEPKDFYPKIRDLQATRVSALASREKEAGQAFIAKAAAEKGATKLPSGMVFTSIKEGDGASPAATDTVKVHYHGTLTNGKVFDSSVQRNEPATFPLNGVIPCWTEGVQKMKVGGKAKLVCPAELAYGDRGAPPDIGPGATLVFEVQLLDIVKNK